MSVSFECFVVCCETEVIASRLSRLQRSPTEYGVSEFDREASTVRRPRPTVSCHIRENKIRTQPMS